ncbi:MAG: extracellular solute-binding protein [Patescibacteria group bacterium]
MQFTRPQLVILSTAGFIILFFLLVFFGVVPGLREDIGGRATLQVWGIDDSKLWSNTISSFENKYPGNAVKYTQLPEASYEKQLLNSLAADKGPDIFFFKNSWLLKHGNKIVPTTDTAITLSAFKKLFPEVAEEDFVYQGKIYSLPLSIDTLALFYNRDIFDNKKIAVPPVTWDELKADILRTREFGSKGAIVKSGLGIGATSKSVTNATDILNLLFLQFGTAMRNSIGDVSISNNEGLKALNFYTQFAKYGNLYYTWASTSGPDIDSFATKQLAMMLGYASQIPEIKAKNPSLNFAITSAPQMNKKESVNFPNYWGLAVSSKTAAKDAAWNFVLFATTDPTTASAYATAGAKPPALRSLIGQYLNSPTLGVFAGQALTAKSWLQPDDVEVKKAFDDMIESVLSGRLTPDKALRGAQNALNSIQ